MKIEIKNLTKTIQGNTVINGINFEMNSGRIYGFQGINGSGKTMLMRLISGLIHPTSGEIIIDGKKLGKDITFPKSMAMLLENPSFLESYSGFQNLKMLCSIKNVVTEKEIKECIKSVGLDPKDKKKYRKYSLGMKQRLGIAGAIVEKNDLIILDEPTNSLDSDGVELVKDIVKKEKERGALIIISCHDLSVLKELSDEILLLKNGSVEEHLLLESEVL